MRGKIKDRIKRIVLACLVVVITITSIPVSGLVGQAAKKDDSWDGTFESQVLGKKPKDWELLAAEKNGEYRPNSSYAENYNLIVTDGKSEGTKAMAVKAKENGTQGYVLAESKSLPVTGGKAYSLNYMMKAEGIESSSVFFGGKFYAIQYDKKGEVIEKQQLGKTTLQDVDWEKYAMYIQMSPDAVEIKLSLYVGGVWNQNKGLGIYLDEISLDALSDKKLLNGGFEEGNGDNDIYSWHLRSTSNVNGPTTADWINNYELKRINGYHGDGVSITRKGIGYVALDSNLIKITSGTTYIIDYAYKIMNAEKTFQGLGAYVSEYDKNQEMIARNALHSRIMENKDWSEFSFSYTPNKDAAYFRIELACGDWGKKDTTFTVYLDDVRVTAIGRRTSNDGVNNGNFEEVYDGTLFDWNLLKREDCTYSTTFDGYNNSKGLYIKRSSKEKNDRAIIQSNKFDVVAGRDYKATYMVRLENQVGNVYVVMVARFYDEKGELIEAIRCSEFDHRTKTEEWQQQVGYYTAPKGAKTAMLEFLVPGISYDCWMDDIVWSVRDDKADIWGFDAVDKKGNLAGWTISTQPDAVKLDKKTYREGTGSLFVSQTSDTAITKIMSDTLIPVEKETRYKFTAWIKSKNCNVATESIRMNAMTYDKDGKKIGEITGLYTMLNESDKASNWMELILGVNSGVKIAYIRPYIQVSPGSMNLWVDDLEWKIYSMDDEYYEDFDSVRDDGTPDGWTATVMSGNPIFVSGNSKIAIEASNKKDVGVLKGRWDTRMEYKSLNYTTTYAATDNAKMKVAIKFYDYKDQEIERARVEKVFDSTAGQYVDVEFNFMLTSAKYMMIEISNEGAGTISCEGILIAAAQSAAELAADEITWRGKWIWHNEDYTDSINSTPRFFRYHFNVPGTPSASNIQITADDRLKLWINGIQVEEEAMDQTYSNISVVNDLAQYMVEGENVIAVRVINYNVQAGLLFDGYVETTDGQWVDFYSTEDTVSSLVEYEGWNQKDFDDSKWEHCKIVDVAVGGTTWEDMTYDASAYVKNKIDVVEYSVTEEITAGEDVTLTMTIIPEIDVTKDTDLKGYVWKRNTSRMVLATDLEQIAGPPMSEWKAGKKITVSYKFNIPDFIGSGKYVIQLDVNTLRIKNMEIMNNKFIQGTKVTNDVKKNTIKAEMKEENGTQALYINGELHPIMSYVAPSTAKYTGDISAAYMHDAGICVTRLWTNFGAGGSTNEAWTGPGEYNFDVVDEYIYAALSDHKDTYLLVSLRTDAPDWWEEENPDELILTNDGKTPGVSLFSEKMLEDSLEFNLAMIEHMKKQPYWNRIIGAVLTSLSNAEWIWYGTGQVAVDYSATGEKAWKEWVKKEYKTDAALQEAWNDKTVTLETVKIPEFYEGESSIGYDTLLDPTCQKNILDYNRCIEETEANAVIKVASTITEAVDDNWILGAYYGYLYTRVFYYDSVRRIHTTVDTVLDDPNMDFFAAPSCYNERYDGESGGFEHMVDGVLAHGKAVIMEDDLRLCSYKSMSQNFFTRDSVGPTYTVSDSLSQLEHLFANQITSGLGNWYYNLGQDYFEREQFADIMELMRNEHMVNYAREKSYTNDVAYIIDEDMYWQLAYDYYPNYEMMFELIYEQKYELTRIGVTMDYYSMSDLEEGLVPDHKIYIMLSPVEVDETEKEAINKYLKNKDKVVLWQYICGASDGKTFSEKNMSDIIGMEVKFDNKPSALGAKITNKKHWLTEGLEGTFYGSARSRNEVSPIAIITDRSAEVLAYMTEGKSQAALAVKDMGDWTSIFSTVPCYTTEMIRNVLEECDVHIYSQDLNDVIYANTNYVGINCAYGGEKTIDLDGTYAVYDVFGQKTYSLATDTIEVEMDDHSTKLYRLTPANKHVVYVDVDSRGESSQSGYHEVAPGKNYTCKIEAKDGYAISGIIIDGEYKETFNKNYKVTFKDVDNSHYVEVQFTRISEEEEETLKDKETAMFIMVFCFSIAVVCLLVVLIIVGIKMSKKMQKTVNREDEK